MNKDFEILYKKAVANDPEMLMQCIQDLYSKYWNLEYEAENTKYSIEGFRYFVDNHTKGHLPPILSPGKMESALKALKLQDDYQVYKPMVMATKKGFLAKIDYGQV